MGHSLEAHQQLFNLESETSLWSDQQKQLCHTELGVRPSLDCRLLSLVEFSTCQYAGSVTIPIVQPSCNFHCTTASITQPGYRPSPLASQRDDNVFYIAYVFVL